MFVTAFLSDDKKSDRKLLIRNSAKYPNNNEKIYIANQPW